MSELDEIRKQMRESKTSIRFKENDEIHLIPTRQENIDHFNIEKMSSMYDVAQTLMHQQKITRNNNLSTLTVIPNHLDSIPSPIRKFRTIVHTAAIVKAKEKSLKYGTLQASQQA